MMRNINKFYALLFCVVFCASCKKDDWVRPTEEISDLSGKAFIKIYNATLSTTGNAVLAENAFLNGGTSASTGIFGYGGTFPSSTTYAAIDAGSRNFIIKDTLITTTQPAITFTLPFEAKKYYTIFTYDTLKTIKYKVVTDDLQLTTDSSVRIRFANFIFSSVPVPNVDVFSFKTNPNIFTNIAPAQVSNFINHLHKSDTLYVRETGTTNLLVKTFYSLTSQRNYTILFRGRYQNTGTVLPRTLTFYTNL